MKNKTRGSLLKPNKTMLVLIVSLALAVLISGTATFAIFTNSLDAQRTVAAYEDAGDRFSSNYLLKESEELNIRTIYVTSSGQPAAAVVTVCNFDQGKQTQPNAEDISYTMTARLVIDNGSGGYDPATAGDAGAYTVTITKGLTPVTLSSAHLSDTFSGTLTGGTVESDGYTIVFDSGFTTAPVPNLYLEITVDPDGSLLNLTGIFKTGIRAAGATNSWTGRFKDPEETPENAPRAYDGFNYRVEGQGSGTFTIKWDNTRVDLSYVSLRELLKIHGATSTANSVTFPVDSDDTSMYDLQFYKKSITTETWANDMNARLAMNARLESADATPLSVVGWYFAQ